MSPISKEVHQYLTVPENLETAVQLAALLPEVKMNIYDVFWKRVHDLLAQRLQREKLSALWCAGIRDVNGGNHSWVGVTCRGGGDRFGVGATNLTGGPDCFFGIRRGEEVPKAEWVPRDRELVNSLEKDGFSSESWWVGWKYFSHAGVPSLDVLQMNRDNDGDGKISDQVAGLIWELFMGHRSALEDLNQSYPYPQNTA